MHELRDSEAKDFAKIVRKDIAKDHTDARNRCYKTMVMRCSFRHILGYSEHECIFERYYTQSAVNAKYSTNKSNFIDHFLRSQSVEFMAHQLLKTRGGLPCRCGLLFATPGHAAYHVLTDCKRGKTKRTAKETLSYRESVCAIFKVEMQSLPTRFEIRLQSSLDDTKSTPWTLRQVKDAVVELASGPLILSLDRLADAGKWLRIAKSLETVERESIATVDFATVDFGTVGFAMVAFAEQASHSLHVRVAITGLGPYSVSILPGTPEFLTWLACARPDGFTDLAAKQAVLHFISELWSHRGAKYWILMSNTLL